MQVNTAALKSLREALGDSQETLAKRAGISEVSYNRIEQGKTRPRVSTIRKLADALRVPVPAITNEPPVDRDEHELAPARRAS